MLWTYWTDKYEWVGKPIKEASGLTLSEKTKMNSFKQLKKASSLGSLTEKLLKDAEKLNTSMKDDRIFSVERDKSGLGYAVIRFMPAPPDEDEAFVRLYNHGFKANNKWFIENCPTSIGQECPVCASNSQYYNSGIDSQKKIASARKRKLSFYSNVYIVKNPSNPELEGTVMLYRYGQKIFDKIKSALKPEFEDESPVDPFDLWGGANFKIKVKTVKEASGQSYPNYDDSSFESPSALLDGDDAKLEELWKRCYSLKDLVSEDKFRSYDDLRQRFNRVTGTSAGPSIQEQEEELEEVKQAVSDENIMSELEAHYKRNSSASEDSTVDDALKAFEDLDDEIPF